MNRSMVQDCDEALNKMGTMMQPVEAEGAAAAADGSDPNLQRQAVRGQRGKLKGAVDASADNGGTGGGVVGPKEIDGYDEDDLLGSYHLATDEEIFGSLPSATGGLSGSALKASESNKSDWEAMGTPSTPTVAYRGGPMSFGGGGEGSFSTAISRGRSLLSSMGAVAPMADLGDDEVFEEIPDHFDFDLDDVEVSVALACLSYRSNVRMSPCMKIGA